MAASVTCAPPALPLKLKCAGVSSRRPLLRCGSVESEAAHRALSPVKEDVRAVPRPSAAELKRARSLDATFSDSERMLSMQDIDAGADGMFAAGRGSPAADPREYRPRQTESPFRPPATVMGPRCTWPRDAYPPTVAEEAEQRAPGPRCEWPQSPKARMVAGARAAGPAEAEQAQATAAIGRVWKYDGGAAQEAPAASASGRVGRVWKYDAPADQDATAGPRCKWPRDARPLESATESADAPLSADAPRCLWPRTKVFGAEGVPDAEPSPASAAGVAAGVVFASRLGAAAGASPAAVSDLTRELLASAVVVAMGARSHWPRRTRTARAAS